ncbi:MAG: HAD-IA family hydrolase [Patescibacteria group bacterium]
MKNIIFDMDGVLMDSLHAANEAFVKMKYRGNTREEVIAAHLHYCTNKPWHSKDSVFTQERYFEILERLEELYTITSKDPSYTPFQEFVDEIRKIESANLAIVSSNNKKSLLHFLSLTDIKFSHALCFEDHTSKEVKIERILNDWGVNKNDFYYVTDTLADIYELETFMPKEHIIGVAWGYCGYDLLARELPTNQILREFKEIHSVINKNKSL